MLSRGLMITGAGGVLGALALAAPSHAAIATGPALATDNRPDLVSGTIGENSDTETPKEVRFCFDIDVFPNPAAAPGATPDMRFAPRYELQGYDVDTSSVTTDTVVDDDENENCVIAVFPDDTTLSTRTVGTVAENAVLADLSGKGNLVDAAPLTGGEEQVVGGFTTGPDLLNATVQPSFNRIRLEFDRRVRDLVPERFSYLDAAGNRVVGVLDNDAPGTENSFIAGDDSRVVYIAFDETPSQSVRDAVRIELADGGVLSESQTGGGEPNQLDAVAVDGQDGLSARPDLLSASLVDGQNAVDFEFDQRVEDPDPDRFVLTRDTGENVSPTDVVVLQSGGASRTIIRAYFDNDGESFLADGETARVAVGFDAVEAQNDGLTNSIGAVDIGGVRGVTGFTSAPDATSVEFDADSGTMLLTFDQGLEDDLFFLGRIRVVDATGNTIAAPVHPDVVQHLGSALRIHIGSGEAGAAVGVSLDQGVVEGDDTPPDPDADSNVRQSIGAAQPEVLTVLSDAQAAKPAEAAPPVDDTAPQPPRPAQPAPILQPVQPATPGTTSASASTATSGAAGAFLQAPVTTPSPAAAAAPAQPAGRVAPATSGVAGKARVAFARYRRGTLVTRITSTASRARVRIALRNGSGRTIKTVTRTVRTNRQVTLKHLTRSSKVRSVRVRVL